MSHEYHVSVCCCGLAELLWSQVSTPWLGAMAPFVFGIAPGTGRAWQMPQMMSLSINYVYVFRLLSNGFWNGKKAGRKLPWSQCPPEGLAHCRRFSEAVRPMAVPQGFALMLEQQVMATSHELFPNFRSRSLRQTEFQNFRGRTAELIELDLANPKRILKRFSVGFSHEIFRSRAPRLGR